MESTQTPKKPSLKEELGYNVDSIVRTLMDRHAIARKLKQRITAKVESAFKGLRSLAEDE